MYSILDADKTVFGSRNVYDLQSVVCSNTYFRVLTCVYVHLTYLCNMQC